MTTNSTPDPSNPNNKNSASGARLRNFLVALTAIALTVVFALGLQTQTTGVSLSAMAQSAVPLETALSNGKPTLMEFYADWCGSCQAMAPDLEALKGEYGDRINFVMLNVDNEKWLPEILSYRVDGIPHFVYITTEGKSIGQAIGEQPRKIIEDNLIALTAGTALPYAQSTGQTSEFSAPLAKKETPADPRSHGSQVVDKT